MVTEEQHFFSLPNFCDKNVNVFVVFLVYVGIPGAMSYIPRALGGILRFPSTPWISINALGQLKLLQPLWSQRSAETQWLQQTYANLGHIEEDLFTTHLKFNMAPEKLPGPKRRGSSSKHRFSGTTLNFQGVRIATVIIHPHGLTIINPKISP